MLACGGREAMVMTPPTMHDSAVSPCFHGCPAILHRHFPPQSSPHIPLIHLFAVNSSPHAGISPQSLNSSSQPLQLPGNQHPCLGYVWLKQGLSDSHSILSCHRQAVSLSALNVSPLIQTIALMWGSHPCFSSPACQGQVQS